MSFPRVTAISLLAALLACAPAFAEAARTTTNTTLYAGPGSQYQTMGQLRGNARVDAGNCQSGFCEVIPLGTGFSNPLTGWVVAQHLVFDNQPPEPEPPQPQPQWPDPSPPQPQPPTPWPDPLPPQPQPPTPWPDPVPPRPQPPIVWPDPVPPRPQPPVYDEPGACFYEGRNFTGASICMEEGDSYQRLNRWNNRIRSVEIFGGARVDLCSDANFYGSCVTLREDASRLPQALDARVTSLEIY